MAMTKTELEDARGIMHKMVDAFIDRQLAGEELTLKCEEKKEVRDFFLGGRKHYYGGPMTFVITETWSEARWREEEQVERERVADDE